jgi:Spy/CpxP family protein refolding chaperone
MEKSWKIILAFAGVFLAGAVCGGLVMQRAGNIFRPAGRFAPAEGFWPQMLQRLAARLDLTPEQREKIRPILRRTQEEVQTLRRAQFAGVGRAMERMHAEIDALLTPEQRVKLEELRSRFRERVERERRELRGGQRPPGPPPR